MSVDSPHLMLAALADHQRDLLHFVSPFTPEVRGAIAERNGSPPPIIEPDDPPLAAPPRAQIRPLRKAV
jgi:hypothetical protein